MFPCKVELKLCKLDNNFQNMFFSGWEHRLYNVAVMYITLLLLLNQNLKSQFLKCNITSLNRQCVNLRRGQGQSWTLLKNSSNFLNLHSFVKLPKIGLGPPPPTPTHKANIDNPWAFPPHREKNPESKHDSLRTPKMFIKNIKELEDLPYDKVDY